MPKAMHKYRLLSKKGEGTFSEVLKAQSIKHLECIFIQMHMHAQRFWA